MPRMGISARRVVMDCTRPTSFGPEHIGVGEQPDDEYLGQCEYKRIFECRKKMGEIPDPRHGKANIADYIGQPVNEVGLVTHVIPESLPGVGVGSALQPGLMAASLAKVSARAMAPTHVMSHPSSAMLPMAARLAGKHKHSRSHRRRPQPSA